jgi:hypothetical protein
MNAAGGPADGALSRKGNNASNFANMQSKNTNQILADDGEQGDIKPDIHQSLGSKKIQEEFE